MTAVIYRNKDGKEKTYYYKKAKRGTLITNRNMREKGYEKVMMVTINLPIKA